MIRLALCGDKTLDQTLRSRLRGAEIVMSCLAEAGLAPPTNCDAVLFIDPGQSAATTIERFLSTGKHVLLTAESWLSYDALAILSAPARQAGVQLAIVNPDRFLPSRQLIRQQLDLGKLGEPGLVRSHHWSANDTSDEPSTLPKSLLRELDVVLWLMGSSPKIVYAVEQEPSDSGPDTGRYVQVHLGFSEGGMALVDCANGLPTGQGYRSLSLIGSAGAAYADDHQNQQLLYRGGPPQALSVDEGTRHLALLAQSFVDGLAAGQDFSPSVTAWQRVLAVADAVRQSLATRQAAALEGR